MKILMIGPGEPSKKNSGLGVACNQIAKELSEKVDLKLFSPESLEEVSSEGKSDQKTHTIYIGNKLGNTRELNADIVHVQIKSSINPYVYLNKQETVESEEKINAIQKALGEYTESLIEKGKEVTFDVIYAHDWMSIPAAIALKNKLKKPLILHIHALDYDRTGKKSNSWLYKLEKQGLEAADAIIAVSNYHAGIISKNYSIAEKKIRVVHHGIAKPQFKKITSPFEEPIILFAGRLCTQKGAMEFIEIAKILNKKAENLRFVMAGEGELFEALISKCIEEGLMDKFHFTGHLSRPELFDLMSESAIFVMPSHSDPFGLSAMEAAYAGLPVILSTECGVKEVLPNAELITKQDPKLYAQRIIKLLQNPEETQSNVLKNQESIKNNSWSNSVNKIVDIFENSI